MPKLNTKLIDSNISEINNYVMRCLDSRIKITNSIEIGDLLVFENLMRDFKLLPVPEINTAVLILL